ncbi:phage tail protein [Pseudescherichia sp.]|uniref:phage tail fiber protein n=2 Tax=Pseudescherichia sp. TaxID=2055881 RepID=UPI00289F27CE|nr:phage tail protein [Pseudescherichia sp.]
MIYTTGTIAGSGNTLTGTGTNFTAAGTLIRNGCTVIVLTSPPQAFQITGVTSATQLAVSPAVNPAIPAGTRYAILLSDSLSVDGLALDIAETFGMYQRYMGGFADVVQSSGIVTITINGKPVTVPGLQSVVQKDSTGTVPVSLGGTGAPTAAGARKNLGLGSAALADIGLNNGDVMTMGGSNYWNAIRISSVFDYNTVSAFLSTYQQTPSFPGTGQGTIINTAMESNNKYGSRWIGDSSGVPYFQAKINDVLSDTYKICAIGKTVTADANGFIKLSSPVIKLFTDGTCEANEEAEGVTATRASVGVYKVTGSAGLNSDGIWTIEIPQDLNGNRLCFVDVKTTKSGVITLSVFRRRFDIDTAMVVAGEPMDIPDGRWLDLRLDMPANSVYNQKRLAAEAAMAEAEALAIKDAENTDQSINSDNQ